MTTQRFAIALLMVALIAADAFAAGATTSTIEGIVVNAANNQLLSGSSVQLLGSAGRTAIASTRSGADGRFEFGKLAAGRYLVVATTGGYQTVTKRVRVRPGKSVFVRIAMRVGRSIPPLPATPDSVEKEEEKVQSSTQKYRFSGVPVRKMVRSKIIAGAMRAGSPAGYGRLHAIGMARSRTM